MTFNKHLIAALSLAAPMALHAAVSPEEAAKLGDTLTPLGAEMAGNADGTIPAWSGGVTEAPSGWTYGEPFADVFGDDEPLFVIDASNYREHADKLSPGHIAMFERYPTWKMRIFPTRRSFANPQQIYDETKANATKVTLAEGGNGFIGTTGGIPFPIPQNGDEAIWNHLGSYRGDTYRSEYGQAAVTASGDYNLVNFVIELMANYSNVDIDPEDRDDNLLYFYLQMITDPARLAGYVLVVHDYLDQTKNPRKAWTYNPGQRRVRLAPNVAYDNPGTAADGLRTNDDVGLFAGATDRYNWELVGKKEMYIPYNAYHLSSPELSYEDVLDPHHINPENARYELHRVWVVDATVKDGLKHIYKRRTLYLDEDSWIAHLTEQYDNRDQLWRVGEYHSLINYDLPSLTVSLETHYDLQSGRYLAMYLNNEVDEPYERVQRSAADFSPNSLSRKGTR